MPNKKVFVFVAKDVVATIGHMDQWCAFAETEFQAEAELQSRYHLLGVELTCIQVIEDRRKQSRRSDDGL